MDKIRIQVMCSKCELFVNLHLHLDDMKIVHSRLSNVDDSDHDCQSVSSVFKQLRGEYPG